MLLRVLDGNEMTIGRATAEGSENLELHTLIGIRKPFDCSSFSLLSFCPKPMSGATKQQIQSPYQSF